MLHRLPRHLPPASLLLADLGNPTAGALAASLGVSVRSVWRWREADRWPRAAHLALYFSSRYGWSAIEADALNTLAVYRGLSEAQGREVAALRADLARLQRLQVYGSANEPRARA